MAAWQPRRGPRHLLRHPLRGAAGPASAGGSRRPASGPGGACATRPGPSPLCPQPGEGDNILGQEDCLYLDVTVPRDARAGKRLPVLVWLHGGGLTSGGAQRFDGSRLAVQGDLVVVTVNYRLGTLGFLSTPKLDSTPTQQLRADGSGSRNEMGTPQRRSVRRRPAQRHPGRPVRGRSLPVCAHLASPISRGLFDRAIVQSGACDNEVPTLVEAREFGAQAIDALDCDTSADVAACLRERPLAEPRRDARRSWHERVNARVNDRPWNPVAGTRVLPRQPGEALREGYAALVPLLVGGTRDEMRHFVCSASGERPPRSTYRTMMVEAFGDAADDVLAAYPATDLPEPRARAAAVVSDWGGQIGACPVLRTAEAASAHQPVYAYEFAEDSGQAPGKLYRWAPTTAWTCPTPGRSTAITRTRRSPRSSSGSLPR